MKAFAVLLLRALVTLAGVALGALLLNEPVGIPILMALALVCIGLILINRPRQVPQKV